VVLVLLLFFVVVALGSPPCGGRRRALSFRGGPSSFIDLINVVNDLGVFNHVGVVGFFDDELLLALRPRQGLPNSDAGLRFERGGAVGTGDLMDAHGEPVVRGTTAPILRRGSSGSKGESERPAEVRAGRVRDLRGVTRRRMGAGP